MRFLAKYSIKTLNLIKLSKGFVFKFLKNINPYKLPPDGITTVGFIDKALKVHVDNQYKHLIRPLNLYTGGKFNPYKKGVIELCVFNNQLLIKKSYADNFRGVAQMHNEYSLLSLLKEFQIAPKVQYIDFKNRRIYMDYIDGLNLKRIVAQIEQYPINKEKIKKRIIEVISRIHANDILLVDVHAANILIINNQIYFVDFADAVSVAKFPFAEALKREELKKLYTNVIKNLS